MQPARSLVIVPLSTVSTHTLSRVWENLQIKKKRHLENVSSEDHYVYTNLNILLNQVGVAIKFAAMLQASGPGKNAGNGVGACRPSLKVELRIM